MKAECEWFLEPDMVVAVADGCWKMPTRQQQIVAGITIVVAATDDYWNHPL